MSEPKKTGLTHIFYTLGSLIMAVLLVIEVINFISDARVLQKPVLSATVQKKSDSVSTSASENSGEYQTLKYKKANPQPTEKPKSKSKTTRPASTPKPTVSAPTTSVDP